METRNVKKTYLRSSRLRPPSRAQAVGLGLAGLVLTPLYWLLACARGAPGMGVRAGCFCLGLRLLLRRYGPLDLKTIYLLLFYPMDSTRYFELDFAWRTLTAARTGKYLDISSPRLIFTLLLAHQRELTADLINPDKTDLQDTETLLRAAGLLPRCRLYDQVIASAPLAPASYDAITCLSVLEHIPEDRQAVQAMWELLKPGGRLLLTVPCAAQTSEQYIDRDEYGVLGTGADGHVFWQRFYDDNLLQERVFSVTGEPRSKRVFGERTAGLFLKNASQKRTDRCYPFWQEPWMVARDYTYFDGLADLPGEGVIALEFVKP